MVKLIQKCHEERIIHRDIKPDNFLIGGSESTQDTIFIIDFGLAKCYKNSDGEHIPYREGKNLTGTARYASVATHLGKEQSRRDDLETIGHVLLYFMLGQLPWQGLPGRTKNEKYHNIKKKKIETPLTELCRGLPACFKEYMEYCKKLEFTETPDYKYLIGLFDACLKENNLDGKVFDYTWKEDRLKRDKQALKEELRKALMGGKKPGKNEETKA